MTSVNVSDINNTVVVTENSSSTVITVPQTVMIATTTHGPQGPQGPAGPAGGLTVDETAKVDKSVVYYDAAAATFKADSIWTILTITDGGNF